MSSVRTITVLCALVTIQFLLCISVVRADSSVVGVGGFVRASAELTKSHAGKIDYSLIKVKLVNSEGRVKGSSECAPNGYYFIPIYDSGSYFVEAEGPAGWNFEPNRIAILPGRDADEDADFSLTGFRVAGRVVSPCGGPVNDVELILEGTDGVQQRTARSAASGAFELSNVTPGTFILRAARDGWALDNPRRQMTVSWGGGEIQEPYAIVGYDLRVPVRSGDAPAPHISVVLYGPAGAAAAPAGCARPPQDVPARAGEDALCVAQTGADGVAVFAGVACGTYTVAPLPARGRAAFDVSPASIAVELKGVVETRAFRVERFAAIGSVVDHAGRPMQGVAVAVNRNTAPVTTDANGEYRLESLEPGKYRLTATLAHVSFPVAEAVVAAGAASLPTIAAARYDVCGAFEKCTGAMCTVSATAVGSAAAAATQSVAADSAGKWCLSLAPGTYSLRAHAPAEKSISQAERLVTVEKPVLDVLFSMARLRVSGRVACIVGTVCDARVALKGRDVSVAVDAEGRFEFTDLSPGRYTLVAERQGWCWQADEVAVAVADKDVSDIAFTQSGFAMHIDVAQVAAPVNISLAGSDETPREFSLVLGANRFCLKKPGVYRVAPRGCVRYAQPAYEFSTAAPKPLSLRPAAFVMRGELALADPHSDVAVAVVDAAQAPLPVELKSAGEGRYTYEFALPLGVAVTVRPSAAGVLFYPSSRAVSAVDANTAACPAPIPAFAARKGLLLEGRVTPAVAGVAVTAAADSDVRRTETDASGRYAFDAVRDDVPYELSLALEGYQFTREGTSPNFRAYKLTGVTIVVRDQAGAVLPGVLVSLSTDGYASNQVTNAQGTIRLSGLRPGAYFVRPVLKEYVFEPATQTLALLEGEADTHTFAARRVAYSCYGTVRGLDGKTVAGAVVEAVGEDGLHEEARTGDDGRFRIRGLPPGKSYTVSVDGARSPGVDRVIPAAVTIDVAQRDADGLLFTVVPSPPAHSVLGRVSAAAAHLPHLTAEITRAGDATVLQSVPVGIAGLFEFANLPAGRYNIGLKAGSGLRALRPHTEVLAPSVAAEHNTQLAEVTLPTAAPVRLRFDASARSMPGDVAPPSLVTLVLMGLVALAAVRRDDTLRLARFIVSRVRGLQQQGGKGRATATDAAAATGEKGKKPKRK